MGDLRSLLGIADFRRLWIAQIVSDFGDSLTLFSLMFLVQRLTGDEAAVASILIATALPALVVGMMAGVWVDRWNLKSTMVGSDLIRAVLVVGLLTVMHPSRLWLLYGIVFVHASVGTFFRPARQALLPRVVQGDQLLSANSLAEATRMVGYAAGTATAGLMVGLTGDFAPIFLTDALTFLISASLVSRLVTGAAPVPAAPGSQPSGVWRELADGIKTLVHSRWLLGVLVAATLAMFGLGAVNGLIVPFVVGTLGISESWFGLLEGAQSAGVVVAGAVVAVLAARFRPSTLVGVGLVAVGVVVAAFATVQGVLGLTVLMALVGL
ncbi:MAG: MFS transporter, partial [Acidimicrobiia bacterium]